MPDRLSMHAPVLVNTLGHCAGAIVFGILLYFLVIQWRRDLEGRSALPCIAAGLALLWNLGSLIGMATAPGDTFSDAVVASSFAVLSLLPAVLLHISLRGRRTMLVVSGYVVSAVAVGLHFADLITVAARFHYAAILLVTLGFATLTAIELTAELAGKEKDGSGKRLAGAMVLFVLAISFVHFRAGHQAPGWSGEAALHHAAIPLALFVLLQDYRFLLLDAFVRFLTNAVLAAVTVWIALAVETRFPVTPLSARQPFYSALAFVAACLLLSLFAFVRARTQRLLTRVVFLRAGEERALATLRQLAQAASCDARFLQQATEVVREAFSVRQVELSEDTAGRFAGLRHAVPVIEPAVYGSAAWAQALAPLRFSRGDVHVLQLGPRSGGRRYLSEDIELLDRMGSMICEQIERMRNSEMQALVSSAELRALQAQINPHFFFNALNTLYGTIPRESATARRLVLNLAELFRLSFASDRTSIRIEEELRIVRAYLEIEQLRLGARLSTEIEVDDAALQSEVPVLSIQPLVENAVKHGVAARSGPGFVRLRVRADEGVVSIEVTNSGDFRIEESSSRGTGVGLSNVRRRLELCFGERGRLDIGSADDLTTVRFSVPLRTAMATVR
ncbi:MAG TPA: histidine kinase [Bryobacteraceae bacterium]|nr:histidine kinase [Bryobacteraceae bacterium]